MAARANSRNTMTARPPISHPLMTTTANLGANSQTLSVLYGTAQAPQNPSMRRLSVGTQNPSGASRTRCPRARRESGSSEMSLVSAVTRTRQQLCQADGVQRLHNGKLVLSWFRGVGTLESVLPQARQGRSVCLNVVHVRCVSVANETPIRVGDARET